MKIELSIPDELIAGVERLSASLGQSPAQCYVHALTDGVNELKRQLGSMQERSVIERERFTAGSSWLKEKADEAERWNQSNINNETLR